MPNRLKYCGPNRNRTLFEYLVTGQADQGLVDILAGFRGAYPYLTFIAHANGIADPLDIQVVRAYWLGNSLLDSITPRQFANFIAERFKGYFPTDQRSKVFTKLGRGGKPHHNFHVYHLFGMTSGVTKVVEFSLPTINNCRISWGKVVRVVDGTVLQVESDQIIWNELYGTYQLEPITKEVAYRLEDQVFISPPRLGQYVSIHWGWVCEVLGADQVAALKNYDRFFLSV